MYVTHNSLLHIETINAGFEVSFEYLGSQANCYSLQQTKRIQKTNQIKRKREVTKFSGR